MAKRTTLADVAQAASVSKTTASLALNGKANDKIPASTRQRVLAAADALQFRPHGVARALVRRRADVLGVVCTLNPFVELAHHAFEQALLSALFHHVLERGYNPMIYGVPPTDADDRVLARYADGRSDGFILLYPEPESALVQRLYRMGIPVVALCCRAEGIYWVDSDHTDGIRMAVNHLVGLGHRRIGYLVAPDVDRNTHIRVLAFRQALQEHGLSLPEDWVVFYEGKEAASEARIARLCAEPEPPTALLTWNDFAACEVYQSLHRLGVRVPEDISIVGFDDIPAARTLVPALTTVRQDVVQMARMAADLAVRALSGSATPETYGIACPVELVLRYSTAPLRDTSP